MFKLLKKVDKKSVGLFFVCIIFIVAQVYLDLKIPDYMSQITRLVETEGSKMADILENGAMMVLCALGSLATAVMLSL